MLRDLRNAIDFSTAFGVSRECDQNPETVVKILQAGLNRVGRPQLAAMARQPNPPNIPVSERWDQAT